MSKDFTLTILGTSSAIPTRDRFPTSQVVNSYGRYYLLDCGEGTQIQLRKYHISFQRIDHIFISHLHADHFLGLPGLLSTMDLLGRTRELHIYAPEELEIFMNGFKQATFTVFKFPIHIHYLPKKKDELLFENDHITIHAFPLKHRVACHGFVFTEKPKKPNVKKSAIDQFRLSIEQILTIKNGEDVFDEDGNAILKQHLITEAPTPKKYAFVTDTLYNEAIIPFIKEVDLLYHEATFAHEMLARAKETGHSTARQAGILAQKANVKKLLIGHYSVRYDDLNVLLEEAKTEFGKVECAVEGMKIEI